MFYKNKRDFETMTKLFFTISVAFSPDGQTLASASADKTIRLWNPNNGKLKRTLTGHTDILDAVAFSVQMVRCFSLAGMEFLFGIQKPVNTKGPLLEI